MPELSGELLATRVAFLELNDERRLIQEGYELLDEKRMLLATEILRQLRQHDELLARVQNDERLARDALEKAVIEHGFDELSVQPPCPVDTLLLRTDSRRFLGIDLIEVDLERGELKALAPSLRSTPELRRCAEAFRALTHDHAALSGNTRNLRRLTDEYVRTERRARALEKVLLPEIDESLRFIEEQLDALDQEEALRVRMASAVSDRD